MRARREAPEYLLKHLAADTHGHSRRASTCAAVGRLAPLRTRLAPGSLCSPNNQPTTSKYNRFKDTYVPYCEEDQRDTEDQGQHVAEGSKSEHN